MLSGDAIAQIGQESIITRLGQPDRISPSRMAEILEVDTTGQKLRC
jgi:hypothetical protein